MIRILQFNLIVFLLSLVTTNLIGQCTTSPYGLYPSTTFTPTCTGAYQSITTCGYRGEYSQVNVTNGTSYSFQSSITTDFITITNSTGTPIIWATGTVNWTANFTGVVRFYTHTNSACGTGTGCRIRRVRCTGTTTPSGCVNLTAFGSATAPTTNSPLTVNTCTYQSEYNTISSVVAGRTYQSSYSLGGYITVRHTTSAGTIVAQGNSPLNWTATVSGTYYIHYTTNSACGTASSCGTTILTCTSCAAPVTNFTVGCGGLLSFDSGGSGGTYQNSENTTLTYCPSNTSSKLSINFSSFSLENNFDYLYVYNGNSSASPLIATYTGTSLPPILTSSDPTGCLTLRFTSDGSVVSDGWIANLGYSSLSPGSHNTTLLEGCVGINPSNLTLLTASSGGSTPYTYQWLQNSTPIAGANLSSYDPPAISTTGIYQINLSVTDACGQVATTTPKEIRVTDDPSNPSATQIGSGCEGDLASLMDPQWGTPPGMLCPIEYSSSLDGLNWSTNTTTIPSFITDYTLSDTNYIRMRVSGGCANGCNASSWTIYRYYQEPAICGILPITLSKFSGILQEGNGLIDWQTEVELYASHFELEKSSDGINFKNITVVTANNSQFYNYIDKYLFSGENYYRLKMVDLDGTFEYSNIIVLTKEQSIGDIYPNPFTDLVIIDNLGDDIKDLLVEVTDMIGRNILSFNLTNYAENKLEFNLSTLSPGNYVIIYRDSNSKIMNKKILRKL